jgi:hypothetical protein
MLLIINNATASNVLIATLKEKTISNNPTYKFEIFNFFTNETFSWTGLTALSNERKDLITLTFSTTIPDVGQYSYTFFEEPQLNIVEVGMAKVFSGSTQSEYLYINPQETDDDYISL